MTAISEPVKSSRHCMMCMPAYLLYRDNGVYDKDDRHTLRFANKMSSIRRRPVIRDFPSTNRGHERCARFPGWEASVRKGNNPKKRISEGQRVREMLVTPQKYYQVHYSKTGEGGEYQMSVIWYVSTNRMCSNLSVATQICTVAIMSGDQSM